MAQWEFYGRQAESVDLAALLQIDPARHPPAERLFRAVGIGGRRGVGKNTLLKHVVWQHGWDDRLLVVRLDDIEGSLAERHEAFLQNMIDALDDHDMTDRLKGIKPRSSACADEYHMGYVIEHLLQQDLIVCLDEVHAILGTALPTILATLIDDLGRCTVPVEKRRRGKLVLMGSHQQKFGQLQKANSPLLGRFDVLPLMPWSLAPVMDIAKAHGWDRRPGRFHTLWTAYGGLPREWQRFAQSADAPPELCNWKPPSGDPAQDHADDQDWRRGFVRHERHVLETEKRLGWDSKTYVELAKPLSDAIIWMGQNKAPGQVIPGEDIVAGIVREARANEITLDPPLVLGDLNDRLEALERDTEIVRQHHHFIGRIPGSLRPGWSLNDNTTLFQLSIAPDLSPARYRLATTPRLATDQAVKALERLAVAGLRGYPHVREAYAGAKPASPKGKTKSDIDVLARAAGKSHLFS